MSTQTLPCETASFIINHLTLSFDEHCLFRDLSFSLPIGKWTCLLGRSGIGKSTLLRFIAGLIDPNPRKLSGTCHFAGRCPQSADLSYLPQQDALLPWLSVLENALLGVRLKKKPLLREKAVQYLQEAGLGAYLQKRPYCLSGGMRQRLALVRILLEEAPLILMDEPFSSLDTLTRGDMQNLAFQLLKNKTVLFITHDPWEALRLGHDIRVLSGSPAVLSPPVIPNGDPPRPLDDPHLLTLHQQLLAALH